MEAFTLRGHRGAGVDRGQEEGMGRFKVLPRCQGALQAFCSKVTCYKTPRVPKCARRAHTPLQSVEYGGLHYVVSGGELMQTLLLHLSIVLSPGIIFLLWERQEPGEVFPNVNAPHSCRKDV